MFAALPDKPDHDALERAVLDRWERERHLRPAARQERRRAAVQLHRRAGHGQQVAGGAHRVGAHAEGRVPALQGAARLPPALPERLRLPGPLDRGRASSASSGSTRSGRSRSSAWPSSPAAAGRSWRGPPPTSPTGSIRLGQWMDWGRDYFTFSDTNIEYIWRFLAIVQERGWLYRGHRSTEWCPRCGTSISAHELAGSYVDREDPSLSVRFPLLDRPGQAIVIWTTTPWTLPANVAAAVSPTAELRPARQRRLARRRAQRGPLRGDRARLATSSGSATKGPSTTSARAPRSSHRVIGWDEVSLEEGTGVVHIAPGLRHRGLRAEQGRGPRRAHPGRRVGPLLPGVRLAGRPRRPRRRRRHHRRPPVARRSSSTPARSTTATPSAGAATRR